MTDTGFNHVLAVDTATRRLNLALLYHGDRSVQTGEVVPRTHGQILMKKIDDLFKSAGLAVDDLQGIVVSLGPGSFTGLRIGLAAAKGIAVARELPLVGVTMFEVAEARLCEEKGLSHVVIPSRKDEFYVGACRSGRIAQKEIMVLREADLVTRIGSEQVYTIGVSPDSFANDLLRQTCRPLEYDGMDVLRVGLEKLRRGERADLSALEPVYLQKAIAEVRFDQRQGGR